MSDSSTQSGGIGVCGLLLVIFITLKVCLVEPIAGWSWWWVFSPMWVPLVIAGAVGLVALLVAGVIAVAKAIGNWFARRERMRRFED